jgi:hypothetical protein
VFRFAIVSLSRTHQRKVKKSHRASAQQVVEGGCDRPVNDQGLMNDVYGSGCSILRPD